MIIRMAKSLKRKARLFLCGTEGASAVEFALVFPIAFVLITGAFEIGMLMFNQAVIEGATREAARFGLTGQGTEAEREARIREIIDENTLGLADMDDITVTTEVYEAFGDADAPEPFIDANGNGTWNSGETYTDLNGNAVWDEDRGEAGVGAGSEIVQYTVQYDWQMMVLPFVTNLPMFPTGPIIDNGGVVHFTAKMIVRNEPFPMPL
jgi:Flp pilus assembly protein TadG